MASCKTTCPGETVVRFHRFAGRATSSDHIWPHPRGCAACSARLHGVAGLNRLGSGRLTTRTTSAKQNKRENIFNLRIRARALHGRGRTFSTETQVRSRNNPYVLVRARILRVGKKEEHTVSVWEIHSDCHGTCIKSRETGFGWAMPCTSFTGVSFSGLRCISSSKDMLSSVLKQ